MFATMNRAIRCFTCPSYSECEKSDYIVEEEPEKCSHPEVWDE